MGTNSIPGWGTKTPHGKKKKKTNQIRGWHVVRATLMLAAALYIVVVTITLAVAVTTEAFHSEH